MKILLLNLFFFLHTARQDQQPLPKNGQRKRGKCCIFSQLALRNDLHQVLLYILSCWTGFMNTYVFISAIAWLGCVIVSFQKACVGVFVRELNILLGNMTVDEDHRHLVQEIKENLSLMESSQEVSKQKRVVSSCLHARSVVANMMWPNLESSLLLFQGDARNPICVVVKSISGRQLVCQTFNRYIKFLTKLNIQMSWKRLFLSLWCRAAWFVVHVQLMFSHWN